MLALKKGCAWVRVAPVPASPLLTGCGRYDLPALQGRDEERAFRSEQGTDPRKEGRAAARSRPDSRQLPGGEGQRKRLGEGALDQRRRVNGGLFVSPVPATVRFSQVQDRFSREQSGSHRDEIIVAVHHAAFTDWLNGFNFQYSPAILQFRTDLRRGETLDISYDFLWRFATEHTAPSQNASLQAHSKYSLQKNGL
jgi:hypothetical protein